MAKSEVAIICWFIVSGSPGLVRADEIPFPEVGSRVRVSSLTPESEPLVGTLTTVDEENLTVVSQDGREPSAIARQDIVRLERSVRPSRKRMGAPIGFGAGPAFMLGKAVNQGGCNDGCDGQHVAEAALVALSTAAVGAVVFPGERWAAVPVGRGQIGLTMSFEAGPQVRLAPQIGQRIGLTVVASF